MTGREPALDEKVVEIEAALHRASIPHAFGGALALAYYAEPRATIDIDVNVFVPPDDIDRVAAVFHGLGAPTARAARARARRDGRVRIHWGTTPVDLFFAYDRFHDEAATRVRSVPFGDATITILGPEDLVVCKAVFDRRKDWLDIEQVLLLTAGDLDVARIRRDLDRIVGPDDPRGEQFDRAVAEILAS